MGTLPVSEAKEKALKARMQELGIREEELQESFVRSGGKGGQYVNEDAPTCTALIMGVKCVKLPECII